MNNFDGIIEFVTVAESQGFSSAANQLDCSTSHISRQISRLEKRLGCALFVRTTRKVNLTQPGKLYYRQCKELMIGLQQANDQLHQQHVNLSGTLRVTGAGTFFEQCVAPVLMDFALEHPELRLDLDFNSRMVNFMEQGIDFAIRYAKLADSNLIARKLVDRQMMAVASATYIQKQGKPEHPNHLSQHSCIISNSDHWSFQEGSREYTIKVNGRFKSNNGHTLVKACEQGLGIAYMPKINFIDSIKQGQLVPILTPFWSQGRSSWIIYPNRHFLPSRARLAIDYLLAYFNNWKEE